MLALDVSGGPFSEKGISVKLRKVGQEYCDPNKKVERRRGSRYDYDSLHFVLYGHGTLVSGGETFTLSKGDVFLLYANEDYDYYPDPADPWSYIWIDFYSNDTVELSKPCGLTREKPVVRLEDISGAMGLLKSLYESYDASELQELVCSAYFILLLSELVKNAEGGKAPKEYLSVKQRHIRSVITYINNNFRLPLNIQKIATKNGISASRMMALFAELVGMSPIAYLNCFRISAACELLKGSNMSIGEVASAVGVEDQLYFSRMFKKWKGVSPREYRAGGEEEDPYAWLKERNIDFR